MQPAWLALLSCMAISPMLSEGATLEPVAPAITSSNWLNHPMVLEVRVLYKDIEDAVSVKALSKTSASREESWGVTAEYQAWSDKSGQIRKFVYASGTEDSAITVSQYHDSQGVLRFAFVTAGAVNGTQMQYRVYFTATGKRFWEDVRQIKGPGYFFPDSVPEEWLSRVPAAQLRTR
jgi:hypothetical protein